MTLDPAAAASGPPQRVVTRFVLEFLVKAVSKTSQAHGGNLVRGLVFFAIQQANVDHLSKDPKLAWKYAADFPPDDVRRPISVHALAQALTFSPETVRRHVQGLIKDGLCVKVANRGVIVPNSYLMSAEMAAQRDYLMVVFSDLIAGLKSINFALPPLGSKPRPSDENHSPETPSLLISRLITSYILRVLADGITVYGDYVRGALFVVIMALNVRHITHDPELAWRFSDAAQPAPDEIRAPVSIRQVAAELRMPYTTVQRNVLRMVADGLCVRQADGFVIPAAVMGRPEILASGLRLHLWLMSTLRDLADLGFDFSLEPARRDTETKLSNGGPFIAA